MCTTLMVLLFGSGVDGSVNLLLLLQRVDILVGCPRVTLGIVEDLSAADRVFESLDLVWGLAGGLAEEV